jgi:uncharacterized protein YcbX
LISVTALSTTPVKGTRLQRVETISLGPGGASQDRRFYVVDERDRMVNSKRLGKLQTVLAEATDHHLRLTLPDGTVVEDEVKLGPPLTTRFYSDSMRARLVEGPWGQALSDHVGLALRLVEPAEGAVDRGRAGAATLISRASLGALAAAADERDVDARRFRMLIEIDGIEAHEEDRWVGHSVQIGEAAVRFNGHVGRCLITSRDPESGKIDLPTLDIIGQYRGSVKATEPLPFGIYGAVVSEGTVRVGDAVRVGHVE